MIAIRDVELVGGADKLGYSVTVMIPFQAAP